MRRFVLYTTSIIFAIILISIHAHSVPSASAVATGYASFQTSQVRQIAASAPQPASTIPKTAAPAAPRPYKVAIQVGHYKNNELPDELSRLVGSTGTYGGGRSEVSLNLEVANKVAALLRAQKITVDILPATVPTGYSADAFVAIHADGNNSPSPRGFKISTRWRSQIPLQDVSLVELLTEQYRTATGLPEDSSITRNMRGYYAYASWRPNWRISNFTPGAIVEMGYMTNAADRVVMFNSTGKVASGIAAGITAFLKSAYGSTSIVRPYGLGKIDKGINPKAPAFPSPTTPGSFSNAVKGDWQVMLMSSKPTVNVTSERGGGKVLAALPRDRFYHAALRQGDYYLIDLPNGGQGWVHRNWVVVQM